MGTNHGNGPYSIQMAGNELSKRSLNLVTESARVTILSE